MFGDNSGIRLMAALHCMPSVPVKERPSWKSGSDRCSTAATIITWKGELCVVDEDDGLNRRSRVAIATGVVLILVGAPIAYGGSVLLGLGGSVYYLPTGIGLIVSGLLLAWRYPPRSDSDQRSARHMVASHE